MKKLAPAPSADLPVDGRDLRNLSLFLFARPAPDMGSLFDTAAAFCASNIDMLLGCKTGGVSMKGLAERLTECGLPITPDSLSRVLRSQQPRSSFSRIAVFACEVGRLAFDAHPRQDVAAPSMGPVGRVAGVNTVGNPHHDREASRVADHAPTRRPSNPILPGLARPAGPAMPVALPVATEPALIPIAGEDEDFCTENTKSGTPFSYGDFRRRAWADFKLPTPTEFAVFDNGERIYVPAKLRASLFDGRLGTWRDFNKKMDAM